MEEQLMRFTEQFDWHPSIVRSEHMPQVAIASYVVCGMGGSHLAADLLQKNTSLNIKTHSDYGLPHPAPDAHTLIIASSYSGETEETLDAAEVALAAGHQVAVVTKGGALLRFAEEHSLPTVVLPALTLEPRMAIGASLLALAHLVGEADVEREIRETGTALDSAEWRSRAEALAEEIKGTIPLVYASEKNRPIAQYWKIACNETAKIPAFANAYPEMCHNELSGFDTAESSRPLTERLHAIHLTSSDDTARVAKRMSIVQDLLKERGVRVSTVALEGETIWQKYLNAVLLSEWTALMLARAYGAPDAAAPIVAECKHRMKV